MCCWKCPLSFFAVLRDCICASVPGTWCLVSPRSTFFDEYARFAGSSPELVDLSYVVLCFCSARLLHHMFGIVSGNLNVSSHSFITTFNEAAKPDASWLHCQERVWQPNSVKLFVNLIMKTSATHRLLLWSKGMLLVRSHRLQ